MSNKSLFEEVGGEEVLRRATAALYASVVVDDELAPFFIGLDVEHIEDRQRRFLGFALGGPSQSPDVDLRKAHAGLVRRGLNHRHFDLLLAHLDTALEEVEVNRALRKKVLLRLEGTRQQVIGETYTNTTRKKTMAGRTIAFLYGIICYTIGMASLVYTGLWLGDFLLPVTLDSDASGSLLLALLIDLALLAGFTLPHSIMARPAFKERWTRIVPVSVERSTYVLFSGVTLIALMVLWQPLGMEIWRLNGEAAILAQAGFATGWGLLVASTFAINHFDLFGLRQVWLNLRGKEYTQLAFQETTLYKYCRHPLNVGWLMVIWITPHMTISHLVFALGTSVYILGAIVFEERDLVRYHPEYSAYQKRVPKFLPNWKSAKPNVHIALETRGTHGSERQPDIK